MSHQKQVVWVSSQSNVVHSEGEHQPARAAAHSSSSRRKQRDPSKPQPVTRALSNAWHGATHNNDVCILLTSPVNVITWGQFRVRILIMHTPQIYPFCPMLELDWLDLLALSKTDNKKPVDQWSVLMESVSNWKHCLQTGMKNAKPMMKSQICCMHCTVHSGRPLAQDLLCNLNTRGCREAQCSDSVALRQQTSTLTPITFNAETMCRIEDPKLHLIELWKCHAGNSANASKPILRCDCWCSPAGTLPALCFS